MKQTPFLLAVAFVACSQPPAPTPAPAPALDRVVLERTPCFGACPIYTLTIEKGGIVHLSRQNRNAPATVLTDTITPAALDLIAQRAAAIRFNSFPPNIRMDQELCPTPATDHPSVNFGLFGATAKQVNYYTGCYIPPTSDRPGTSGGGRLAIHPRLVELAAFGAFIDSLANSGRGIVKGGGGLDSVVLERSGFCFGTCPQYRLSVSASGVVRIERDGARQVPWPQASVGLPAADADRVDAAALDIIARRASEISFRKLPTEIAKDPRFCRGVKTDNPSVVVGLFGKDPWNVDYYTGCITPATADSSQYPFDAYARLLELRAFAGLIDSVANSGSHIVSGRAAFDSIVVDRTYTSSPWSGEVLSINARGHVHVVRSEFYPQFPDLRRPLPLMEDDTVDVARVAQLVDRLSRFEHRSQPSAGDRMKLCPSAVSDVVSPLVTVFGEDRWQTRLLTNCYLRDGGSPPRAVESRALIALIDSVANSHRHVVTRKP